MEPCIYDHYVAVDWSIRNMAIARMTAKSNKITLIDVPSDVAELQCYLKNLKGTKVLTIEESTASQWLYIELRDHVDRIIICDPYRNRLLGEGPKSDTIDASKLVRLLKGNLLKEVYHSNERFLHLRRVTSGYGDLIKAGVRLKNQRYSFLRACGLTGKEETGIKLGDSGDQLVLDCLDRRIEAYEKDKETYEEEFRKLSKEHPEIRHQDSLPGIGVIGAVKLVSRIVSPHRFADKGHFLSYAGLVKLDRKSAGVSYGRKKPRYCREVKSIFKSGTLAAIGGNNEINDYFEYLIREKGYAEHNARHKACRKLAVMSWGVFKSGKKYRRDYVNETQDSSRPVNRV